MHKMAFMWPFTPRDRTPTDRGLVARVEELERKLETIDVEWTEWYDKYRRLYARIAKRVERDPDDASQSRQDAPGSTKGGKAAESPLPRIPRTLRGF